ncbi:hypothetical protein G647_02358 [Cladophialophora carrionii CBS 160.54]|uniref:Uncharacterized protein n=1 Tax=Cladophialophora carrionii CBS 160.54 TaxID=1279043 RepID=V9DFB5_9EURO|nr:uncharacterized protein G647_02358 [Cladophialophora carrionii CBS 160.54]ETI25584.1 hypothetical protein G647_02358 [Cladophialophora carrionii CBS 160.54]
MRLLKFSSDGELSFTSYLIEDIPRYAILSHTWGAEDDEVTFNDLKDGSGKSKLGYKKIQFCGEQARRDSLQYFWVDTCCIDKANHTELSEAIVSMFSWYRDAEKCYAYLSDVSVGSDNSSESEWTQDSAFKESRWFTRGWTLQELLAPKSVEFFSRERELLGDRNTLEQEIHEVTKIPIAALRGSPLTDFSVDERMRWAEKRITKRKEDKAYCLLGIFGVFMPLLYGEKDHAYIRLKDQIDGYREGSIHIPLPRNMNFVGRDQIVQDIHTAITSRQVQGFDCIRCAVYGMGGIGKTQTILEYAYRYRKVFSSVFWVKAHSYESAVKSYCTIAQKIGLVRRPSWGAWSPENQDVGTAAVFAVKERLTSREYSNWLLLLDGWDDLDDERMESLIPHAGSGVVLITSRREDLARAGCSFNLPLMEEATSLSLLSKSSLTDYGDCNPEELKAAKEIVRVLGNLPLAIDQAGAHMHARKMQAAKYLSRLTENAETLDWKPPTNTWAYHNTVLSSWDLTFKEFEKSHPDVFAMFQVCGFLAGENISEDLLTSGFKSAGMDALAQVVEDGMGNLFSFSLAKREAGDGFSIHTIVQTCVRQRLSKLQRQTYLDSAILLVAGAARELSSQRQLDWLTYRQLLAHVNSCQRHLDDALQRTTCVVPAKEFFILGRVCDQFGQPDQAIRWFKQGLNTTTHVSTQSNFECRDGILTVMLNKGQLHEALAGFQTLYAEAITQLGVQHELTNKIANSIGIIHKNMGSLEQALAWYETSLSQVREKFGERDQRTLATWNNIAVIYKEQKEYGMALDLLQDVLGKKEAALGEEHPSTLETLMNLGNLYRHCERYDEALRFLHRALRGREKQLGKDNPKTLEVKGNIASVYFKSGRLEEAIKLHEETYHGYKQVYGAMHHAVLTLADWLGGSYCRKGLYVASLKWYEEALCGRRRLLGEGNTKTLETVTNMAEVFEFQGRFYRAMIWYKWALDGFRRGSGLNNYRAQLLEHRLRALLRQWHQRAREVRSR